MQEPRPTAREGNWGSGLSFGLKPVRSTSGYLLRRLACRLAKRRVRASAKLQSVGSPVLLASSRSLNRTVAPRCGGACNTGQVAFPSCAWPPFHVVGPSASSRLSASSASLSKTRKRSPEAREVTHSRSRRGQGLSSYKRAGRGYELVTAWQTPASRENDCRRAAGAFLPGASRSGADGAACRESHRRRSPRCGQSRAGARA